VRKNFKTQKTHQISKNFSKNTIQLSPLPSNISQKLTIKAVIVNEEFAIDLLPNLQVGTAFSSAAAI
jgi:hypothetical protein